MRFIPLTRSISKESTASRWCRCETVRDDFKPEGDFDVFSLISKNDEEVATFKQLRKYGVSKYEDIELKKGNKYRIVEKRVKKEKRYIEVF